MHNYQEKPICQICSSPSKFIFKKTILKKYNNIEYYKCPNCGFIQTSSPFWVEESYEKEAISIDPDRIKRNIYLRNFITKLINHLFEPNLSILDFAGGEGLLTRMLRDRNFNCWNYDKYSSSLYSYEFNISNLNKQFDLIISSEVMEHLPEPEKELQHILQYTNNYFFTTCIQPKENLENWFYLIPDNGQHISFYTTNSLAYLAQKYNMNFYSDFWWCHFFTKKDFGDDFSIILPMQFDENKLELKTLRKMSFTSFNDDANYVNLSKSARQAKKKYKILNTLYTRGVDITNFNWKESFL